MIDKKGAIEFNVITVTEAVIGALAVIVVVALMLKVPGLSGTAEASTKKAFDDIIFKVSELEEGKTRIANGYIDAGTLIAGFSPDQREILDTDLFRPRDCASPVFENADCNARLLRPQVSSCALSGACICACRDFCSVALVCKDFPRSRISHIKTAGGSEFVVMGEKSFSAEFKLEGSVLTVEEFD